VKQGTSVSFVVSSATPPKFRWRKTETTRTAEILISGPVDYLQYLKKSPLKHIQNI
jgi:hypothetical protein